MATNLALAVVSTAFVGVFGFGVRVTLVCVPEPSRPLLFAADKWDPVVTASTKPLPNIRVAIHASRVQRLLERSASCRADAVRERLVVPESRVLQHQPSPRLANATPSLSLVAVSPNPARGVQVVFKSQLLLIGHHLGIRRIHVLGWWGCLLFLKAAKQVRGVREICVEAGQGVRLAVALENS